MHQGAAVAQAIPASAWGCGHPSGRQNQEAAVEVGGVVGQGDGGQFSLLRLQKQVADTDERDREQGAVAQGSREAGQQGDRWGWIQATRRGGGVGTQRASVNTPLYETGATRLVQSSVRGYPRSGEDCVCRDQGQGAGSPLSPLTGRLSGLAPRAEEGG